LPDFIDDGSRVIFLLRGRKAFSFIEDHSRLIRRAFPFSRLRNRRNEFRTPPTVNDPLRRLALIIQFPMPAWSLIRGIKDGMVKKWIAHLEFQGDVLMRQAV